MKYARHNYYSRSIRLQCSKYLLKKDKINVIMNIQGGSNMTGADLYVNKPHFAAAVRT